MDTINQGGVKNEYEYHCKPMPATSGQVERLALNQLNATHGEGVEGRGTTERFGFENIDRTDANGAETRADILRVGDRSEDQVRQFGLAGLNKTGDEGYRNLYATTTGTKDILLAGCQNTETIKSDICGGVKDIMQQNCGDTKDILMQGCGNTKDLMQQACYDTASINKNLGDGFSAGALAGATQTASIINGQTIGFKDTALGMCDSTGKIMHQASNISAQNMQSIDRQFCAVERNIDSVKVDVLKSSYETQIKIMQSEANLSKEAVLNAKDAEISRQLIASNASKEAMCNYNALAKQLAECCCEQEKAALRTDNLIASDGDKTRRLIESNEIQELRDKVLKLEIKEQCGHHHRAA